MNKKDTDTAARRLYAAAYEDYLRDGDLPAATRKVAHEVYLQRGGAPGNPEADWKEAERVARSWSRAGKQGSLEHLLDKTLAKAKEWLK